MESLQGQLLVSSGSLLDPNFRHTVVLLGRHDERGALGVVLNRTAEASVGEAVPPLAELVGSDERLFLGGPVQPTQPVLLAELTRPEFADVLVFGSIGFLTGDVSSESQSVIRRARVYAGYAGWGPGQLEAEMQSGSWILEPARAEDVFTDAPEELWSSVLERKGGIYRRLAKMPFDPSFN